MSEREHSVACQCEKCRRFWNERAVASPQATRPERICGNCGLPLVQNETEEACRELDKVAARLEARRAAHPAAGTTPLCTCAGRNLHAAWTADSDCPIHAPLVASLLRERELPRAEDSRKAQRKYALARDERKHIPLDLDEFQSEATTPQAERPRPIEAIRNALSKLESQICRNPDLPAAYRRICNDGFDAIQHLEFVTNNFCQKHLEVALCSTGPCVMCRAVAPVETPECTCPTTNWIGADLNDSLGCSVHSEDGQTRLTAEQFAHELEETLHDLSGVTFDLLMNEAIKHKLEAFRDKSEGELNVEIDRLREYGVDRNEMIAGLREEIERLKRGTMSQPSKSEELKNGLESIGIIWIEPTDLRNRVGKFLLDKGVKMGVKIDPGTVQNMMTEFTEAELTKLAEQEGK